MSQCLDRKWFEENVCRNILLKKIIIGTVYTVFGGIILYYIL